MYTCRTRYNIGEIEMSPLSGCVIGLRPVPIKPDPAQDLDIEFR
ncbi:hypothetical protein ASZ90_011398 [hydrocarbon metagenome]|uniref:Uncharacterized protein n=1 Tax=hydrocarbon metagenome TaxID=938273 RepID=A0A0W8FDF4_9ZZZZ